MPALALVGKKMASLRKKGPQFIAESLQWCTEMGERIRQTGDCSQLANLWRDEIVSYIHYAFFLVSMGVIDLPNRVESELRKWVEAEDASTLLANLSSLSAALESLGPTLGLGKVARGELSREAYLEAYGHRGENETECAWPRPLEDPTWLDRQLAAFAQNPMDIEALFARQQAAYQAVWDRFCQRYPHQMKTMQQRLEQAEQAARQHEAIRSAAARGWAVTRAFALRAGEITGIGEDVFFLTIDEVLALLGGDETACQFIPLRKETYACYTALPPYPTLIVGSFDPIQWAADPHRHNDIYNANAPAAPHRSSATNVLRGFGGTLGIVEGTMSSGG
jgi:pyruvate,water dikinase